MYVGALQTQQDLSHSLSVVTSLVVVLSEDPEIWTLAESDLALNSTGAETEDALTYYESKKWASRWRAATQVTTVLHTPLGTRMD